MISENNCKNCYKGTKEKIKKKEKSRTDMKKSHSLGNLNAP